MKKAALILFVIIWPVLFTFGESFSKDGMLLGPKSLDANVGAGTSWYYGINVGAGCEYVIGKFDVTKSVPLSFGAAARVQLYIGLLKSNPLYLGGFGTLHLNWGALDWTKGIDWLANLDSYFGVGVKILPSFGFDTIAGSSYFFTKNLAANFEAGLNSGTLGVLWKF